MLSSSQRQSSQSVKIGPSCHRRLPLSFDRAFEQPCFVSRRGQKRNEPDLASCPEYSYVSELPELCFLRLRVAKVPWNNSQPQSRQATQSRRSDSSQART
jgi:hypothetical protein